MSERASWVRWFAFPAILAAGLIPLAVYWWFVGRAPTVTPEEAGQALDRSEGDVVLVDVRPRVDYEADHLQGALSWPFDDIMAARTRDDVPTRLRNKRLLLMCDDGIQSGMVARKLHASALADAANVQGGLQAWVASADQPCGLSFRKLANAEGRTSDLPHRDMTLFQQWAAVIAGFALKPLYMLFSLILIVVLRGKTMEHLIALRWAMIFFLAGEAACALNYGVYREGSMFFEYLHSFGMVVSFSFAVYALLEALDNRLIKYSDSTQRCAAVSLCNGCIKHMDVPCKLKRLFLVGIPALLIVALTAFCAAPIPVSYNVTILGSSYSYTHAVVHQLFEIRYCPALAMLLLSASFVALAFKKKNAVAVSKVLFAAALGPLGFSFFRAMLLGVYRDDMVWFVFWEEATEMLFILVVGGILRVFWSDPKDRKRANHGGPASAGAV